MREAGLVRVAHDGKLGVKLLQLRVDLLQLLEVPAPGVVVRVRVRVRVGVRVRVRVRVGFSN